MKALTLTQPWAHLVASGQKLVENRSWNPPRAMFGQRFAIHASRELDLLVIGWLREGKYGAVDFPDWKSLDERKAAYSLSSIVGVATLVDFVTAGTLKDKLPTSQHRWFVGPVGFVLADARRIASPVDCKGSLGFWSLPADVAAKVEAQL